jgi:hypothetical protein
MPKIHLSTRWWLSAIILTMILGLARTAAAQHRGFGRGGESGAQGRRLYNPQTVTTVQGQVEDLGSYGMQGWRVTPGMKLQGLVLKTGKGNLTIDLGPPWYVRKQGFAFSKGDTLEVTGSKVTKGEQTILLAAEVKKNGHTLKVRDEKGVPLWREQDRGGRGAGGRGRGGLGSGGRSLGNRGQINW